MKNNVAKTLDTFPETILKKIQIVDTELEIETVKDMDSYLDSISDAANENEDLIPYWSEIWPSGIALARHIISHFRPDEGHTFFELGSGTGVLATILTKYGFNVIPSDFQEFSLSLIKRNILHNCGREIEPRYFDWRFPDTTVKYDFILAADVIYERRSEKPLINVFKHILAPGGTIFLAEPNRQVASHFFLRMKAEGFVLNKATHEILWNDKHHIISIYTIF
jgi:predicted nicotinamide N-methyase